MRGGGADRAQDERAGDVDQQRAQREHALVPGLHRPVGEVADRRAEHAAEEDHEHGHQRVPASWESVVGTVAVRPASLRSLGPRRTGLRTATRASAIPVHTAASPASRLVSA